MYTYIYLYIYTHTHTHTHTQKAKLLKWALSHESQDSEGQHFNLLGQKEPVYHSFLPPRI